eukprot:gnl/MRDRNA2_/MRDRNA2_301830_c0_seq1.p1 gnl/MRDRNA2_/MRDRNA2_301830_c0~~gnl/MRDRNA2_/MRDRNA2_301830_c0_seq1.p1  ORF type:complete len:200 (+),score=3.73 gnl/MRDRNA2_/MRDRNA2_301830_c0_seq1:243-842(+)
MFSGSFYLSAAAHQQVAVIGWLVATSFITPCYLAIVVLDRRLAKDKRLMIQQISNFQIANTECSIPEDKPPIMEAVVTWFGSTAAFDTHVRTTFSKHFHSAFGTSMTPISYQSACLRFSFPVIICMMDYGWPLQWFLPATDTSFRVQSFFMQTIFSLCGLPNVMGLTLIACDRYSESPQCCLNGCGMPCCIFLQCSILR